MAPTSLVQYRTRRRPLPWSAWTGPPSWFGYLGFSAVGSAALQVHSVPPLVSKPAPRATPLTSAPVQNTKTRNGAHLLYPSTKCLLYELWTLAEVSFFFFFSFRSEANLFRMLSVQRQIFMRHSGSSLRNDVGFLYEPGHLFSRQKRFAGRATLTRTAATAHTCCTPRPLRTLLLSRKLCRGYSGQAPPREGRLPFI